MFSAYPQGIQDVGDFVFSVEHKRRFLTQTVAVCQSYNAVNETHGFERQTNIHRQNQIKPCGSWRYIEVLRHETIGLYKKLNSIFFIFYLWSTAMSNCPERVHNIWRVNVLWHSRHMCGSDLLPWCLTAVGIQLQWCITATYCTGVWTGARQK